MERISTFMSASLYEGGLALLHLPEQPRCQLQGAQVILECADGRCSTGNSCQEVLKLDAQRVVLVNGATFHLPCPLVGHRSVKGNARVRIVAEVEPQRLVGLVDHQTALAVRSYPARQEPGDAT